MKASFEKADFILRVLTFVAVIAGGGWAIYQYEAAGATDWTNNITLDTKVLLYRDDLRPLVVHVRSKNPEAMSMDCAGRTATRSNCASARSRRTRKRKT